MSGGEILFNLEIQIEDDKTANIVIRENDDIDQVVNHFCEENSYGDKIKSLIMNQIVQSLDSNIEELEGDENSDEEVVDRTEQLANLHNFSEGESENNFKQVQDSLSQEISDNDSNKNNNSNKELLTADLNNISSQGLSGSKTPKQAFGFTEYNTQSDLQTSKSFSNFVLDKNTNMAEKTYNEHLPKPKAKFRKDSTEKTNTLETCKSSKINSSNIKDSKSQAEHKDRPIIERLYTQHMEKLPKRLEQIRKINDERRESELKELRPKPEINERSLRLASKSPVRQEYARVEDRLIRYGQKKKENIIKAKTKKQTLELDHPYYPTIDDRSRVICTDKRRQRLKDSEKILNKTSDDIRIRGNDSNIDDQLESDEELNPKYRNVKVLLYTNQHMKLDSDPNYFSQVENKGNNSFVSSKYTFTNMKSRDSSRKKEDFRLAKKKSESNFKQSEKRNTAGINSKADVNTVRNSQRSNISYNSKSNSSKSKPLTLDPQKNIHDFLYLESKLIDKKKNYNESEYMKVKYPFKPTVSKSSNMPVTKQETREQFIKRLMNSKKEAEELIVKQKGLAMAKVDQKTGKPLFKPTVGRAPKDPKTREVTVNLDGFYDNKLLFQKHKVQQEKTINILEKKKLFLQTSMKSILKMKIESYKEIFDRLDSDKDGYISSRNIKLSTLDSEMLNKLTPILEALQKNNSNMNFKEFCLSADKYLSVKLFNNSNCSKIDTSFFS